MKKSDGLTVIGYVRVSVDEIDKISPDVQRKAIEDYAGRKGWDLSDVVVERGRSAGEGKRRPKFDRVREAIVAGSVHALVVYRLDRASRSVADFADLWRDLDEADAEFVSVSEGFDTSTAMGRAMLQIAVVFAELERSTIVERTKEVHRYRRSQHMAPTGIPAYGYRKNGTTLVIDEAEAVWVRQIFDWLLDGVSLREVSRRLAAAEAPPLPRERREREKAFADASNRGEEPPSFPPARFGWTSIRNLALSPTVAGLRDDPDTGGHTEGGWEPIIDSDEWRRLRGILSSPARRVSTKRTPSLLSGIARCGECRSPMRTHYRTGRLRYRCVRSDQYPEACQGLSIDGVGLEEYVEQELLSQVEGIKLPAINLSGGDDIDELQAKLDDLANRYGDLEISFSEWQAARRPLAAHIEAARASGVARERDVAVTAMLLEGDLRDRWPGITIDAKRAVIRQLFDGIIVAPSNGRRGEIAPRVHCLPAS